MANFEDNVNKCIYAADKYIDPFVSMYLYQCIYAADKYIDTKGSMTVDITSNQLLIMITFKNVSIKKRCLVKVCDMCNDLAKCAAMDTLCLYNCKGDYCGAPLSSMFFCAKHTDRKNVRKGQMVADYKKFAQVTRSHAVTFTHLNGIIEEVSSTMLNDLNKIIFGYANHCMCPHYEVGHIFSELNVRPHRNGKLEIRDNDDNLVEFEE